VTRSDGSTGGPALRAATCASASACGEPGAGVHMSGGKIGINAGAGDFG
jgi:hypothetical protein